MGTAMLNKEKVLTNIVGLLDSNCPLTYDPISQALIDADQRPIAVENAPLGSLAEQQIGTLYTRLSNNPAFYYNKDAGDNLFKDCVWQSVAPTESCWICDSANTRNKLLRKEPVIVKGQEVVIQQ